MPRPYVVLALLLAAAGCGPPAELIGVYEEAAPLELGRTRAIRLTLFAYSGEAGGKMETFLLGDQNTTEDPYLVPEACAFFGPRDISNSAFALDVRFGEQQVAGRVFDVSSGDRAEVAAFLEAIRESELKAHIRREESHWMAPFPCRGFEILR